MDFFLTGKNPRILDTSRMKNNICHLLHDEILNRLFFILNCIVSLASICHDISTDIFNFTQIWKGRVTEIQQQLDVTICSPRLEKKLPVLHQSNGMCSFHFKMWYPFSVIVDCSFLYQFHTWCINLPKLWFGAIVRPACPWGTKFNWLQAVPVTLVHHTVLGQLSYISLIVTRCTESCC